MSVSKGIKEIAAKEHLEDGVSLRELAKKYDVTHVSVGRWVKAYAATTKKEKPKKKAKPIKDRVEGLPEVKGVDGKPVDRERLSGSLIEVAIEGLRYKDGYRQYHDELVESRLELKEQVNDKNLSIDERVKARVHLNELLYNLIMSSHAGVKMIGELARVLKSIGVPGYDGEGNEISPELYNLFKIAQIAERKE
jgi:transposase-like protein